MKMSERNQLLIEFQNDVKTMLSQQIDHMEKVQGVDLTPEEIKGALQHVSLTFNK